MWESQRRREKAAEGIGSFSHLRRGEELAEASGGAGRVGRGEDAEGEEEGGGEQPVRTRFKRATLCKPSQLAGLRLCASACGLGSRGRVPGAVEARLGHVTAEEAQLGARDGLGAWLAQGEVGPDGAVAERKGGPDL